jgi:hypothetical protein
MASGRFSLTKYLFSVLFQVYLEPGICQPASEAGNLELSLFPVNVTTARFVDVFFCRIS